MVEKKKLLHIVEAMGGGVFTYLVELANELVETYDVYIAYSIRQQTPYDFADYFDKRIKLIKVESFTREINLIRDIKAATELKRIAKMIKPELIHLHSSKAGVLGRWIFDGKDISLFYTPHGYSFLMQNCGHVKKSIYWLIEKISSLRSARTISCSEGEHNESLKLTMNASFVNNGINMSAIDKMQSDYKGENNNRYTVFTLGRICPQKNPSLFNQIAQKLPDIDFIWIGDGEDRELLTASNILITGWLARHDALKISLKASTFLLTSLWEGLPISLLEAMYLQKTCVVSNVIGNNSVIRNGYNGFCCDYLEDYIDAINNCRYTDVAKLVSNANHDIVKLYNTKSMATKYIEIYEGEVGLNEE